MTEAEMAQEIARLESENARLIELCTEKAERCDDLYDIIDNMTELAKIFVDTLRFAGTECGAKNALEKINELTGKIGK